MNINVIDVFEPMGVSPIPVNIRLVSLDDDSVDDFDTPLCNAATSSTHPISFNNAPCKAEDPHDELDDDIDEVRAPVNTGAMVTCTGQRHIMHGCSAHTKLQPCPVCLKAASDANQLVIPEGHGHSRCHLADGQGHQDVHVCCHPNINGTLLGQLVQLNRHANQTKTSRGKQFINSSQSRRC